jgi:hypothetical protein
MKEIIVSGQRATVSNVPRGASVNLYDMRGNLVRSLTDVAAGRINLVESSNVPLAKGHYVLRIVMGSHDVSRGIWVLQ